MKAGTWICIERNEMPLETAIMVAHPFGVEYIMFSSAQWRYCYSGEEIKEELRKSVTHFCIPENPNKQ
mgnify:CR=1 FL=1